MVEDMPAYRGIIVTHKTVCDWAEKYGRDNANTTIAAHRALVINGILMRLSLVTDKLRSYSAVNWEIGLTVCGHHQHKGLTIGPRILINL